MTIPLGAATPQTAGSAPATIATIGIGGPPGSTDAIPVPTVVGKKRDDAVKLLKGFGFKPSVVEVTGPENVGNVYGQQPKPDELAPRGATVKVFVIVEQAPDESGKRFDAIDAAIAKVQAAADALATTLETEESAKARHAEVMEAIAKVGPGSPSRARSSS